ncbi:MAG: hypothetical protein NDI60_06600 [Elusimicrobiales bacterium]|nr:hypothetical protein [Elusimicrobiales bacterium]
MKKFIFAVILAGAAGSAGAAVTFEDLAVSAADLRLDAANAAPAAAPVTPEPAKLKIGTISKAERRDYITRAQTWRPESSLKTDALDFKTGPYEKMKYAPEELVTCSYVPMAEAYDEGRPNGTTRKFKCADKKGKQFKVKYGADNGELMTEVASSWILTAIGAYADRMYPVRLNCPDCPSDPFKDESDRGAWQQGQMVVIEDKIGERMEYKPNSGIGFDEFHLMTDRVGAEALSGLAHFLGNSDNKAPNQAIACQKGDVAPDASGRAVCLNPIAYMQDLGISFGGRTIYHNSRMNFDKWKKEKLWDDPRACVMHLSATHTSSITGIDPSGRDMHQIGEQARQTLVRRLSALSRAQLTDIFTAARAPLREPRHSAEEWADLFLEKVEKLRSPMGAKTPPGFACPYQTVPPNSAQQPSDFPY